MTNVAPTRRNNCIVNVFISFLHHNFSSQVVNTDFSDQVAILISVEKQDMLVSNPGTKKIRPRSENGFNALSILSWDFIENQHVNIEDRFQILHDIIVDSVLIAFPEREVKT
ncbi:hypothetical protein HHI36_012187 [Cryptolaemus montrouzieri]|uniref:Uncharacterized protein n=1 Tax=Cryptolaemus montrouzieri TaxID=559131 RepID=A0ABD2NDU4_9CUCU